MDTNKLVAKHNSTSRSIGKTNIIPTTLEMVANVSHLTLNDGWHNILEFVNYQGSRDQMYLHLLHHCVIKGNEVKITAITIYYLQTCNIYINFVLDKNSIILFILSPNF